MNRILRFYCIYFLLGQKSHFNRQRKKNRGSLSHSKSNTFRKTSPLKSESSNSPMTSAAAKSKFPPFCNGQLSITNYYEVQVRFLFFFSNFIVSCYDLWTPDLNPWFIEEEWLIGKFARIGRDGWQCRIWTKKSHFSK